MNNNNQIACNVSNCAHFGEGNICTAEKISVSSNTYTDNNYSSKQVDMEIGSMDNPTESRKSKTTQCITFKPAKK
ncbi:MAG: DUF1540 domain-containing protein [Bacillota bacterium]